MMTINRNQNHQIPNGGKFGRNSDRQLMSHRIRDPINGRQRQENGGKMTNHLRNRGQIPKTPNHGTPHRKRRDPINGPLPRNLNGIKMTNLMMNGLRRNTLNLRIPNHGQPGRVEIGQKTENRMTNGLLLNLPIDLINGPLILNPNLLNGKSTKNQRNGPRRR